MLTASRGELALFHDSVGLHNWKLRRVARAENLGFQRFEAGLGLNVTDSGDYATATVHECRPVTQSTVLVD